MVNNTININKANNYLSIQTKDHEKRPWHMALEFDVLETQKWLIMKSQTPSQ
jgi:hypothetical protein